MKCINCTKFIQCSLDKQADENKKECIYFIHRNENIIHIPIDKKEVRRMLEDE
jgi:hypothetical protein